MQPQSHASSSDGPRHEPPPIRDRADVGRGFRAFGWPLVALGLIGLLLIQTCVPRPGPTDSFDAAAAVRSANDRALARLTALAPDAAAGEVFAALNLGVVNFASASAQIPDDAMPLLERAAERIGALPPDVRVLIAGHTDSSGTAEGNAALSERRAAAVRDLLVARGVAAGRLVTRGFGDTQPVANNATEEGRFRNRRIEFARIR
jgi:outer membrane protein OmpA-like peptidoglycan-associated protein